MSWSKSVISTIDEIVDFATKKVVRPVHKVARGSVYSLVIATLATLILAFVLVAVFRATTLAVDTHWAYIIWGGIFFLVGALFWAKK